MKNLVEELKWRGLYHDSMPGTEEQLLKEATTAYIGFDPTADSLHIGSMVQIILLLHLKNFGHKPIALVGGATGMIGDPSGKSDERNLLNEEQLAKNVAGIKSVLSRFLDFNSTTANAPVMVNNYDWMRDFSFISFARDVGKRITVNYMMSKESVRKRIKGEDKEGMSFTEFTYQLIQGYDFYHLHKTHNCLLQMGGSDQWGNITTGTELVRRMNPNTEAKAFALTTPLITKADGSKFGKSEGGNIWLDADKTSVYKFYQFWRKTSDVDAEKYIKIFTFLDRNLIEVLISEHRLAPHLCNLQKRLAEEITILVHGRKAFRNALIASEVLFGKSTAKDLRRLDAKTFLDIFEGIPQAELTLDELRNGISIIELLNEKSGFLKSNSEARRALAENSISINKEKITDENFIIYENDLLNKQFILIQRGKKNYFILYISTKLGITSSVKRKKIIPEIKAYRLRVIGFRKEKKYADFFRTSDFLLLPNDTNISKMINQVYLFNRSRNINFEPVFATTSNNFFAAKGTLPLSSNLRKKLRVTVNQQVEVLIRGNEIAINYIDL